jgi:hypothetical protein
MNKTVMLPAKSSVMSSPVTKNVLKKMNIKLEKMAMKIMRRTQRMKKMFRNMMYPNGVKMPAASLTSVFDAVKTESNIQSIIQSNIQANIQSNIQANIQPTQADIQAIKPDVAIKAAFEANIEAPGINAIAAAAAEEDIDMRDMSAESIKVFGVKTTKDMVEFLLSMQDSGHVNMMSDAVTQRLMIQFKINVLDAIKIHDIFLGRYFEWLKFWSIDITDDES